MRVPGCPAQNAAESGYRRPRIECASTRRKAANLAAMIAHMRNWRGVAAMLGAVALLGCGSGVRTSDPAGSSGGTSNANLNGNWKITGSSGGLSLSPYLSGAFAVNGNAIFVKGSVRGACGTSAANGDFDATGNVESDGTFKVGAIPRGTTLPPFQISISGKLPASSGASWAAAYSIKGPIGSCTADMSGTDTAIALPAVSGTFAGTMTTYPAAGSWQTTLKLTQSATPIAFTGTGGSQSVIPVTGTIDVTGTSCFRHGTSFTDPSQTYVGGNYVFVGFTMDDGSQMLWSATVPDTGTTSIAGAALVKGGACDGVGFSGLLLKQ